MASEVHPQLSPQQSDRVMLGRLGDEMLRSGKPFEQPKRENEREFLDWVREQAVKHERTNTGRTANMAREHLRAVPSRPWNGR